MLIDVWEPLPTMQGSNPGPPPPPHSIYPYSLRYLPGPDPKIFITSFGSRERVGGTAVGAQGLLPVLCLWEAMDSAED